MNGARWSPARKARAVELGEAGPVRRKGAGAPEFGAVPDDGMIGG